MPTPGQNETREDFIKRCIPMVIEEGTAKDGSQANAICNSIWRRAKMETIRFYYDFSDVKLQTENGSTFAVFEILRVGKFDHPVFGEFEVTKEMLEKAVGNFKAGVPDKRLAVNFHHAPSRSLSPDDTQAAGWFGLEEKGTDLFLDGDRLFAKIRVLPKTKEFLENEGFKFASAEFNKDGFKDEAGKDHGFAIEGFAITNDNFIRNQQPAELLQFDDGKLKQLEFKIKKEEMKVGGHTYLLTKKESKMFAQLQKELGVDSPELVMDAVKQLKEKKADTIKVDNEAIVKLEKDLKDERDRNLKLAKTVETMSEQFKTVLGAEKKREEKSVDDELKALQGEGYIIASQMENYKTIYETSGLESFNLVSKTLRLSDPPYSDMLGQDSSEGDGEHKIKYKSDPEKGTAVAQEVQARLEKIKSENEGFTQIQALNKLRNEDPKLFEKYERGE